MLDGLVVGGKPHSPEKILGDLVNATREVRCDAAGKRGRYFTDVFCSDVVPDRENHLLPGFFQRDKAVKLAARPALGEEGWTQDNYAEARTRPTAVD